MIDSTPRFLNGAFGFSGTGYDKPALLSSALVYVVPPDKRAQLIFLRAGNSSDELTTLMLMQDGKLSRVFPIGAKSAMHVPLAVVEDIQPDTKIEIYFAAPAGVTGTFIVDMGLIEI